MKIVHLFNSALDRHLKSFKKIGVNRKEFAMRELTVNEMEVIRGGVNWKYYPDAICVTWALVNVRTRLAINLLPGAKILTAGYAAWGLYRFVDSYFLSS